MHRNNTTIIANLTEAFSDASNAWMLPKNDGVVGEIQYNRFVFVTYNILLPVLSIIGLVCSGTGIFVLYRTAKEQKNQLNYYYYYLCSLLVTDTLYLLAAVARCGPHFIANFDANLGSYLQAYYKRYDSCFRLFFFNTSAYIILIISLERLLALAKPHNIKEIWLSKYPLRFVVGVFVFNVILSIPILLTNEVKTVTIPPRNTTKYVSYRSDVFIPKSTQKVYNIIITAIYIYAEVILAIIFNIAIVCILIKLKKNGPQTGSSMNKHHRRMTFTTLLILAIFLLLIFPKVLFHIWNNLVEDFDLDNKEKYLARLFPMIADILAVINCSVDFPVYLLGSSEYRQNFKRTMVCCSCQIRTGTSKVASNTTAEDGNTNLNVVGERSGNTGTGTIDITVQE